MSHRKTKGTADLASTEDLVFEHGLRFDCTRCGNCCRQKEGALFLTAVDLRNLAECLKLSDEEFFMQYCEVVDLRLATRVSLVAEDDGDCIFWGEGGCEVYEHRPLQCRTFPFWASNLTDAQAWQKVGETCRGVDRGKLWSPEDIRECVKSSDLDPLLDVGDGE